MDANRRVSCIQEDFGKLTLIVLRFEDVRQLLSCRETLLSVVGSNDFLLDSLHTRAGVLRNMEVEALVSTSTISRRHGALQDSLTSVTYLSDIVQDCKSVGLEVEATAKYEQAKVLWDHGEQEKSIRLRQELVDFADFDTQDKSISLPVLLAKLVRLHKLLKAPTDYNRAITLPRLVPLRQIRLYRTTCSPRSGN